MSERDDVEAGQDSAAGGRPEGAPDRPVRQRTWQARASQAPGRVWLCPTPIGNLDDMTPRALAALREADVVCAEDTRVTGRLLAAFGVKARLVRMDENTIAAKAPGVVERVLAGENVAFCSDAGMPGVSDPGARLVAEARRAGAPVTVLPGPTAGATAYAATGFLCPHYLFHGFFPRKAGERARLLAQLSSLDAALVFYESPRRLVGALGAIAEALPERRVAVCRELTKVHEEVVVDAAPAVADEFRRRAEAGPVRGEVVIVVDAPSSSERRATAEASADEAASVAKRLLEGGGMSKRDVAAQVANECGVSRSKAYDLVLDVAKKARG